MSVKSIQYNKFITQLQTETQAKKQNGKKVYSIEKKRKFSNRKEVETLIHPFYKKKKTIALKHLK